MARFIVAMLILIGTVILVRNLALESPLMAGDEYAYFAAAQTFPDSARRFAFDPYLPRIYSPVFAAYGGLLATLSRRPELLLKALNTLAFLLTALLFLRLVTTLGGGGVSRAAAAVFLLLPISSYTAYFMPETTYALLFAILTWAMTVVVPTRIVSGVVLSGALVGTMLLVKPHALALFVAVIATLGVLVIAPASIRPRRRAVLTSIVLFILSTYVTLVSLNGALTHQLELHPLTFVGGIYRPYLSEGMSLSSWLGRTRPLVGIFAGHLIVLATFAAPALALGAAHLRKLYQTSSGERSGEASRRRTLFVLIGFTASATLVTLAMTTNFTAQAALTSPGEHLRLHGRYYSFVIPLYLLLYFAFGRDARRAPAGESWIRAGAVVGCVSAALLYYLQSKRIIYPFDYPEAFAFSGWHGRPRQGLGGVAAAALTYAGIAAAIVSYALMLWRGHLARTVYPLMLIFLFSISNLGVTAWQYANSVGNAPLRADARAIKELMPLSERDRGLVIGPEWNGPLAYFLFNCGSSARVLVRARGSRVTETDLPTGTRWVLLIGGYEPVFRASSSLRLKEVTLLRVNDDQASAGPDRR